MKAKLILTLAFFLVLSNSDYSISQYEEQDIVGEADLLLDMMEYKAAIVNYLKALSQDPQQRDVRKKIGYAYFRLGKTDDALRYQKEELMLFPDNGDAYDLLVYILYKLDKIHEANNFLESLDFPVALTEENPHIGGLGCFILGMYFKEIKEYERAAKFFRKAMEKEHNKVECFVQLIDIELSRGELECDIEFGPPIKCTCSPESILAEAAGEYQFRPEFLFIIGLRYFKDYFKKTTQHGGLEAYLTKSIKSFELASKLKPDFKDALFNLGCISYNFKDFKKASEYFGKIREIEPENDEIQFYLDCCCKKLNKSLDKKLITEQCPKWIELSREFIDKPDREYKYRYHHDMNFVLENVNNLGLEFVRMERYKEAIKRFHNGLEMDPENAGFHFNIGMVYSWLDNLQEAEKHDLLALRERDFFGTLPAHRKKEILEREGSSIEKPPSIPLSKWTFEEALKEGNYFLDAWNSLGTLYFKKEEFGKSLLAFEKVIEIYPEDAMGHYNLGCTYWALEDQRNAEKEWRDAIKYEKKLKREKKMRDSSEDQLDISLTVFYKPVSFRAHKFLGRLYLEQSLPDRALKEFRKAIELEPGDPEPYYEIGKIYEEKSEHDERYVRKAISYYEKYIYLGGEKEKEVRALLKSLK